MLRMYVRVIRWKFKTNDIQDFSKKQNVSFIELQVTREQKLKKNSD